MRGKPRSDFDPVQIRIYDNLFSAAAEEMGAVLGRLGFSPNIMERRDYSTAIFDARAEVVAQAAHIPVHLGSMPLSVASAIARLDLAEGDVALLNDPFSGGTHLPDITAVAPVFLPGDGETPSFYVANRAHHADVGGMAGGSMAAAREIYQEGLRIPPVRYLVGGRRDESLHRLLLANMRNPREREGDLAAQLASLRVGAERLLALAAGHGREEVVVRASQLQDYSAKLVEAIIEAIPDGSYAYRDHLDPAGGEDPPGPPIQVTITVKGRRVRVDFTGSAPQVSDNRNANRAIALSAVSYVFRCLGNEDLPTNAGCIRPLEVITPEGTIVAAAAPAAVAAGNVETSQRIVDCLLGALAEALPGRIPAASQGTMNNLTIAGIDPRQERPFTYYETIGGGTGAGPESHGPAAIHSHMTNTLNTPIEVLEAYYPFRVTRCAVRRGSGGRGATRGGDGMVREIELLCPAEVAFTGERHAQGPAGLHGGEDGAPGRAWLVRGGKKRRLGGRFHEHLEAGDIIRIETPGGGGYGERS